MVWCCAVCCAVLGLGGVGWGGAFESMNFSQSKIDFDLVAKLVEDINIEIVL